MAMSVFERRSEIGSLRAMGWRTSRVIRMILSESLLLAAAGAAVGVVIGLAGLVVVVALARHVGLVQGDVSYRAIGEGVLMAAADGDRRRRLSGLPHRPRAARRIAARQLSTSASVWHTPTQHLPCCRLIPPAAPRSLLFQTAAKLPHDDLREDRQLRAEQVRAAEPVLRFGEGGVVFHEHRPGRLDEPRGLGVAAEAE